MALSYPNPFMSLIVIDTGIISVDIGDKGLVKSLWALQSIRYRFAFFVY